MKCSKEKSLSMTPRPIHPLVISLDLILLGLNPRMRREAGFSAIPFITKIADTRVFGPGSQVTTLDVEPAR